ncbi:hypothetical protein B0O99DRAFT_631704 [Bisporella sp. PMI_857]|nr:hypothetical protein B0O99DRAFT_631704 [Bisporella sp. PMI_857]
MERSNFLDVIGHNATPTSSYPPSYHSTWQSETDPEWSTNNLQTEARDLEKGTKEPDVDVRPIEFLRTRATTFGTLAGNGVSEKFGQAQRWITRSGTMRPENPNEDTLLQRSRVGRKFSGWRGGVLMAVVSAGTVLCVNLCFTIWAAIKSKSGMSIGTIYEDDCDKIKTAGLWTHIAINIMGTLLLGSSNYTMQCLSSPTRKEADAAHAIGRYVDIGIPSLRNLRSWRKKMLFAVLVISTIPLHFLWNSAVFITKQQLDYQVYIVTPDFFKPSTVDCSQNVSISYAGRDSGFIGATFTAPRTSLNDGTFYYTPYPLKYEYTNVVSSDGDPNASLPSNGTLYTNGTTYTNSTATSSATATKTASSITYTSTMSSDSFWWQRDTCNIANSLLLDGNAGKLQRLTNQECINAYGPGNEFMKGRSDLLVVTKGPAANSSSTVLMNFRFESFVTEYNDNNWVCDPAYLNAHKSKCDYRKLAKTANEEWNLGWVSGRLADPKHFVEGEQWPIDYCLSRPTDIGSMCQLQYSLIIMITVLIANMTKFGVIFYFLWSSHEPVLATIGDGIASYLERPDPITTGYPLMDRRQARRFRREIRQSVRYPESKTMRWWSAPSLLRWIVTLFFCAVALVSTAILLNRGIADVIGKSSGTSPFKIGFGNYNEAATLNVGPSSGYLTNADFASNQILLLMVTVANIPQVIVSCLYFAYNTIYTSMVSADEFSRFTANRKSLRTTDPRGQQRSTYWLSLPWTYGLPLAAASSVLHWLISQSLFVARTAVLTTSGEVEPLSYMSIGYSPLAILISLLFGLMMVITMVVNGSRKLKGGILVANNSLAIAAACQRPKGDEDAHLREVMWGDVAAGGGKGDMMGEWRGKGHCAFTSKEVEAPQVGELYI